VFGSLLIKSDQGHDGDSSCSGGLQKEKAMKRSLMYWVRLSIAVAILVGSLAGAVFLTEYLRIKEPYRSLIVIATGLVMGLLAFSIALIASKR
jgi:ABC-type branched-subunit amino acid transport system permease subunit